MPKIIKLASVVPEKNATEIFCDADARRRGKTTDSDPYMSPPLKRAGNTNIENKAHVHTLSVKTPPY